MKFRIGDLVRIIEDPSSFFVGDEDIDQVGIVIEYKQLSETYVVLVLGTDRTVKALNFMLQPVT